MHQADTLVRTLWFGFNKDHFFFRLDLKHAYTEEAFPQVRDFKITLKFVSPLARVLSVSFVGGGENPLVSLADENGVALSTLGAEAKARRVFEMSLPFERLGYAPGSEVQFMAFLSIKDEEVEHWPTSAPLVFKIPAEDFEANLWNV
jgi:hypothetical protein